VKARRKGDDLPLYSRAVVELAEEKLPDPEDRTDEYYTIDLNDLVIVFRRVPTTTWSNQEGRPFWRWELIGRVDPATP
jgi:hypothetical protein